MSLSLIVDIATNDTEVLSAPGSVLGWEVITALSAHIVQIKDGGTSGTAKLEIPASTAAGTFRDLSFNDDGVAFDTTIHVDPNDVATGRVIIYYKRLPGRKR